MPSCGHCIPCATGRPALCEPGFRANTAGTLLSGERRLHDGHGSVHHHLGVSGFAQYAVLAANSLVKVPGELPFAEAALFGCAVITGVGAVVNTARMPHGASAAVIGLGGVGLAALLAARMLDAEHIVAVDMNERKLAVARELGAPATVNASEPDAADRIREHPGRGAMLRRQIPSPERMRLLERYLRQADDLERLALPIPETELFQPANPDGWSLHQVLVHIRDVEVRAYHLRLERILRQDNPLFEDFDAEGWMREHYRESEPVQTVVTSFNAARQRAKMLTADMIPEDWQRTGTHPETGPRSFEWWMIRSIDHAQEHLDEVERRRHSATKEDCMPENIQIERRGRVGLIRLHRPRAMNALNQALMQELAEALQALDADPQGGAIVICGDERAFAAGADIKEMAGAGAMEMLLEDRISL